MHRRAVMLGLSSLASAPPLDQPASLADLKGDVAILREALRLHPGLYRYNRPDEIDSRLQAFAPSFTGARDLIARYLVLSRFLATLRCGHTYANFFNQSGRVASDVFDRQTRLPFRFRWIEGRMVVTADPEHLGLAPGTEITAINGISSRELLKTLLPYARADGHNDAKRRALLEVQGYDPIEYFDVFHGLIYGVPRNGTHRLELLTAKGNASVREVPALDLKQRRNEMGPQPAADAELWNWRVSQEGVAILTMPTWAVYNTGWHWKDWLKDRLDSLKGARGLVIDLRANEGGNDCGHPILARLAQEPIQIVGTERRVRFQTTPPALDPYLDTWDESFRALGVGSQPVGDGFYRLQGESGVTVIAPEGPRFTGPVAALIGPVCSSATFQFALLAKTNRLLRLYGEPTGGNLRGINGGSFFFVRLPASGLEFDLPLVGFFPPGHPPDAGLNPDIRITPSREEIATAKDAAFEAAMHWILSA